MREKKTMNEEKTPLLIFYQHEDKIGVEFGRDENNIGIQLKLIGFMEVFLQRYKDEMTMNMSDDENKRHFTC